MKLPSKQLLLPFSLTALVIALDQASKAFIVHNWPRIGTFINDVFNNDFLHIYHVRNKAIAFSIGSNVPDQYRLFLFVLVPVAVLGFLVWYYFKTSDFTPLQRWALAGIIGGGLGNIIDRIFRPDGVVDFVSVKFYGLLGMERWPTFNVADSSVVVSSIILLVTMAISIKQERKNP
ncbi:MAG: signal peptidase II [Treponema sp.]|nr:signal peptidase II [Treponema sp.]